MFSDCTAGDVYLHHDCDSAAAFPGDSRLHGLRGWAGGGPRGVGSFVGSPLLGYLESRINPRKLLTVGFIGFGVCSLIFGTVNLEIGPASLLVPILLTGFALSFVLRFAGDAAIGGRLGEGYAGKERGNEESECLLGRHIRGLWRGLWRRPGSRSCALQHIKSDLAHNPSEENSGAAVGTRRRRESCGPAEGAIENPTERSDSIDLAEGDEPACVLVVLLDVTAENVIKPATNDEVAVRERFGDGRLRLEVH